MDVDYGKLDKVRVRLKSFFTAGSKREHRSSWYSKRYRNYLPSIAEMDEEYDISFAMAARSMIQKPPSHDIQKNSTSFESTDASPACHSGQLDYSVSSPRLPGSLSDPNEVLQRLRRTKKFPASEEPISLRNQYILDGKLHDGEVAVQRTYQMPRRCLTSDPMAFTRLPSHSKFHIDGDNEAVGANMPSSSLLPLLPTIVSSETVDLAEPAQISQEYDSRQNAECTGYEESVFRLPSPPILPPLPPFPPFLDIIWK